MTLFDKPECERMEDEEDSVKILTEDMDDEILARMPEWFRVMREAYLKVNGK